MNLRRALLATLIAVGLVPAIAVASSPTGVSPDFGETSPTSITVVLNCEIVEIRPEDGTILLRELESGAVETIEIADGIKLRARRKKDFDGRRKLAFSDLSAGQKVKVTINRETGAITQIAVLKATAA